VTQADFAFRIPMQETTDEQISYMGHKARIIGSL